MILTIIANINSKTYNKQLDHATLCSCLKYVNKRAISQYNYVVSFITLELKISIFLLIDYRYNELSLLLLLFIRSQATSTTCRCSFGGTLNCLVVCCKQKTYLRHLLILFAPKIQIMSLYCLYTAVFQCEESKQDKQILFKTRMQNKMFAKYVMYWSGNDKSYNLILFFNCS